MLSQASLQTLSLLLLLLQQLLALLSTAVEALRCSQVVVVPRVVVLLGAWLLVGGHMGQACLDGTLLGGRHLYKTKHGAEQRRGREGGCDYN